MAGRYGSITKADIALAAATAKTVLQLGAVNVAFKLKRVSVSFDGILNTAVPPLVEILRQSTAGTMTNHAPLPGDDSCADALNTTGRHTASAEPTAGVILEAHRVHPQTSLNLFFADEYVCGPTDYIGIRVTSAAVVNVSGVMGFEE